MNTLQNYNAPCDLNATSKLGHDSGMQVCQDGTRFIVGGLGRGKRNQDNTRSILTVKQAREQYRVTLRGVYPTEGVYLAIFRIR